ncbi:MAG: N-acetylmuramoyl-L-alanine amidase [Saprospiraceae bacterium]|nr:N-acetylmuramoyl-L-alanine amidase [Saprospiraceae bacterium]
MFPYFRFVFFTVFTLFAFTSFGNDYYEVTINKGDNLTRVLQKYNLTVHQCNQSLFVTINKLKNSEKLLAEKKYFLPVKIYKYNGKSIRSTLGLSDLLLAKKIEQYNIDLFEKKIRKTHYKTSKVLLVPDEFISCNKPETSKNVFVAEPSLAPDKDTDNETIEEPEKVTTIKNKESVKSSFKTKGIKKITVPLMGKEFEDVWIEDFSLKNEVYYIISGHGGPDPGAVYKRDGNTYCEDEYAYDVALRLARNLMAHGAVVHMIVEDENDGIRDEKLLKCDCTEKMFNGYKIPLSQKKRLRQRASMVNTLYQKYKKQGYTTQKAIEIHVDSRNSSLRQDVFFYYNASDKKSKKLAESVHDIFESKYDIHQKNRGYQGFVEDRNIYMVKNLRPTTLFVELANIQNPKDQERLIYYYNRQALANWLFEGLRK